jgi:hypothetical protein
MNIWGYLLKRKAEIVTINKEIANLDKKRKELTDVMLRSLLSQRNETDKLEKVILSIMRESGNTAPDKINFSITIFGKIHVVIDYGEKRISRAFVGDDFIVHWVQKQILKRAEPMGLSELIDPIEIEAEFGK